MKYIFIILIFVNSSYALDMIVYDITGNLAFDFFYSLSMNLGLIIWGFTVLLRLLRA